jgi:hypothetical protein
MLAAGGIGLVGILVIVLIVLANRPDGQRQRPGRCGQAPEEGRSRGQEEVASHARDGHSSGSVGCAVSSDVRRSTSSFSASAVCSRAPSTSWPQVKVWTWRLSGCCSPKSIVINVPLPQIGQMVDSDSPICTTYTEAATMGVWLRTRSINAP